MVVSSTKDNKAVLVLNILEEHFGDVVRDVAEVILTSEHCTLAYIVRTLNSPDEPKRIDVSTVRQAMVILLHHNCLIVELNPDADGEDSAQSLSLEERAKMVGLLYRLNNDNIMNRLRFCSLLKIVNDKFSPGNKRAGEAAVLIVEEVILHGRVRLPQIRQAVTQTLSTGDFSEVETHALIQETFEQLVQNRYIISVPQLDIKKRVVNSADGIKVKAKNSVFNAPSNAAVAAANSAYSKKGGTTAASLTSSSIGNSNNNSNKRGRHVIDAELEDEQELLPVEMRMMTSGDDQPTNKSIKVEPGDSAGNKASKGGRLGGRLGGRGGRGGRGGAVAAGARNSGEGMVDLDAANFDEAAFLAGDNGNGGGGLSSSSSSNSAGVSAGVVSGTSVVREDKMWMVCWDQLIREERHASCKQVTTDRMESMAGVIVSVILDNSMNTELGGNQPKSAPMNVREILTGVNKRLRQQGESGGGGGGSSSSSAAVGRGRGAAGGKKGSQGDGGGNDRMEEPALKKLLEFMRLSSTALLIKAVGSDGAEGGPSYMVNMEAIVQLLVRKTIHSIAVSRYGEVSGRIVELLQRSKYVDQQTVSDMIILPARETRERLYKLYLDKWVNYLEMSKRGDFNPSSNYYFWYLDLPKLIAAILDHFYKAIYNLRLRRADEVMKGKQLLDFAITNEADEVRYKALITRLNMLDDAVIKLDKSILVLEKY